MHVDRPSRPLSSAFDALTRAIAMPRSRRPLLGAGVGGAFSALLTRFAPETAAGCKKAGAKCKKNGNCCAGGRCRHGRCRCKQGWSECGQDGLCHNLSSDAINCGACGQLCLTGCCVAGVCDVPCGDDCCAQCFVEADGENGPPHSGTEFCCPASLVCTRETSDPTDDLCCWPDEVCIDGECCCDRCLGTVACGGTCCSSGSCCNGKCCAGDQVCARTKKDKPRTCVSANRGCASDGDCFAGEACWGGTCCYADRRCFTLGPNTDPVCCSVGSYCDLGSNQCCANGKSCSTSKKVRIHAG